MYTNTYTDSLEATTIMGAAEAGGVGFLVSFYLGPISTGLLSTVTATLRWHDGILARSKPFVLSLTSLGNLTSDAFPIWLAEGEEVTLESTLIGNGTYRMAWSFG